MTTPTYRDVLVLDLSTAPLPNVAAFLEPEQSDARKAPGNYSKPEAIAEWRRKDYADDLAKAALDLDLARITGVGIGMRSGGYLMTMTRLAKDEHEETALLEYVADLITVQTCLVSFNGTGFDWPMLMRRACYLGVVFPTISCDKYRSPHCDVLAKLSLNESNRKKSLGWYVRRHGWTDLSKPLSGAEEAQVPVTGRWDELQASLTHDVVACGRLAGWLGLIEWVEAPCEAVV